MDSLNELLKKFTLCLPENIDLSLFTSKASDLEWMNNPEQTLAYVLSATDIIDWNAYMEKYKDVSLAGINGALHFLKYGIHEGRKLSLKEDMEKKTLPFISIIICSYNNELYLPKCIQSAMEQTLKNIEIIIIDDHSNDKSPEIISNFAKRDKRIISIKSDKNLSQHHSRIIGVNMARGKYIMFLDSDDFYTADACEKAYEAINSKYDIACFNTNIINAAGFSPQRVDNLYKFLNLAPSGVYPANEILPSIFIEKQLNATIWNKIYKTDLCKKSFAQMEDGFYPGAQDIYEFMVIVANSSNLYKFDDFLYNYNYGVGAAFKESVRENPKLIAIPGDILPPVKRHCEKYGHNLLVRFIKDNLFEGSIYKFINLDQPDLANKLFDLIIEQYGLEYTIQKLVDKYFYKWDKIAGSFKNYKIRFQEKKEIKTIGIFYPWIAFGGVETYISLLCGFLISHGYKVVLFLEKRTDNDKILNKNIKIYYLHSSGYTKDNLKVHHQDLICALKDANIDLMLYEHGNAPALLWDLIILRSNNIPTIVTLHTCFITGYNAHVCDYDDSARNEVLKCADKLICLSIYAELYFRCLNIDAEYIPNPVAENLSSYEYKPSNKNIIVVGRLGDKVKQLKQCLFTLSDIIKKFPDATMYFVGDFFQDSQVKEFYDNVIKLKLTRNVRMTGWADKPQKYMKDCSVLLSTSYSEAFPMVIEEAQAMGLPCVIYDLPIMAPVDNQSVITVPQGDYRAAADEICKIFENPGYALKLSAIAKEKVRQFLPEKSLYLLLDIINNFHKYSNAHNYTESEYHKVINFLTFYANKPLE